MTNKKIKHDFWHITKAYLNQPLFVKEKPICFNPFQFRRDYFIQFLERCWQIDYQTEIFRLRLETGWQGAELT